MEFGTSRGPSQEFVPSHYTFELKSLSWRDAPELAYHNASDFLHISLPQNYVITTQSIFEITIPGVHINLEHWLNVLYQSKSIMSSPTKPVQSSKPRKKATVTPRSFGRFFTPRTSLERLRKNGMRRRVFGDITTLATNQRASKRRRIYGDTLIPTSGLEEESLGFKDVSSIQQHDYCTPETTPERSSPLRRYAVPGHGASPLRHEAQANSTTDLVPGFDAIAHHPQRILRPLLKSHYHSHFGDRVRRELGSAVEISKSRYCEG